MPSNCPGDVERGWGAGCRVGDEVWLWPSLLFHSDHQEGGACPALHNRRGGLPGCCGRDRRGLQEAQGGSGLGVRGGRELDTTSLCSDFLLWMQRVLVSSSRGGDGEL